MPEPILVTAGAAAERCAEPFEGGDCNYTLTRLPGWLEMIEAPARIQPPLLSRRELAALPRGELLRYNDARKVWHANLGPFKTPQLLDLHDGLAEIVESNRQDGDKNKPAALVDSYPGLGKTTAVLDYARQYYLEQIELRGQSAPGGHRRGIPRHPAADEGTNQIQRMVMARQLLKG